MLKVHFLNVGHGECTIIEHPSGRLTMIDINASSEYDATSFAEYAAERRAKEFYPTMLTDAMIRSEISSKEVTDPVAFMKKKYQGRRLWRFILTHPDLDHMRGLKRLATEVGFNCFWDTNHTKTVPTFRSNADREDWDFYQSIRDGDHMPRLTFHRGDRGFAFAMDERGNDAGGDHIEILSPTPALVQSCNACEKSNDLSYVLRVRHAGQSLLLTGDIEEEGWSNLQKTYGRNLKSNILSASHHGRDSGYHLPCLQLIDPATVIVSVGRKPITDASGKYRGQCGQVLSTRYYGNIEWQVEDNGTTHLYAERNGGQ